MDNFLEWADKRKFYLGCLVDIKNYLDSHSESIQYCKRNNIKGVKEILNQFIDNIDDFIKYGDDIEIVIPNKKE